MFSKTCSSLPKPASELLCDLLRRDCGELAMAEHGPQVLPSGHIRHVRLGCSNGRLGVILQENHSLVKRDFLAFANTLRDVFILCLETLAEFFLVPPANPPCARTRSGVCGLGSTTAFTKFVTPTFCKAHHHV